jgi:hypothetical protein
MWTHSKNFILFSAILSLGFASCKKGTSNVDNHVSTISVAIDGKVDTFGFAVSAGRLSVAGGYGIGIAGFRYPSSAMNNTSLSISISRPTQITTGTYIENVSGNPLVKLSYINDMGFDNNIQSDVSSTSDAYGSLRNPVTITITNINSATVKGTFSGELLSPGLNIGGPPFKTVLANGVFDVAFH